MKATRLLFLVLAGLLSGVTLAQTAQDFVVEIEEFQIPGSPGLQSFVHAELDGKWLFLGGRTDGLHRRRPFESFLPADNNTEAFVIDPATANVWSASLASLPTSIFEQLQSTNMNYEQRDSMLYIIGGYGYSPTAGDHITHPRLTAVNVRQLMNATINAAPISTAFRQITDNRMRVTGGYLDRLGKRYYLAGGQNFEGRYNPMGPGHGPGFKQEYTNAIRSFEIVDNGTSLSISNYQEWIDTANLHRRDYNMVAQVFPDATVGFTMFSGVFQHQVDLPWLNTVDVRDTGYHVRPGFNQYLNQYHTAHLPVFDAANNAMHSLFFGGMSRYTLSSTGQLVDDPDVPFVSTVSKVTRFANDSMAEVKIGDMPGLLGSGAEFIPLEDSSFYDSMDILQLDSLPPTKTLVGYLAGGIESTQPNIFFVNNGTQSDATTRLFKVFISRNAMGMHEAVDGDMFFHTSLYPNPAAQEISLEVNCPHPTALSIDLLNLKGAVLRSLFKGNTDQFSQEIDISTLAAGTYFIRIANAQYAKVLKFTKA